MTFISIRRLDGTVEQITIEPDIRPVDEQLLAYVDVLDDYLDRSRSLLPVELGDDFASALFDLRYFIDEHVPEDIDPLP